MGRKLIALSTSDWHLNNWKQFNENGRRLSVADDFLFHIMGISHKEKIPVLFSGDMFHTPEALSNAMIDHYTAVFEKIKESYPRARLYGISGNHDEGESIVKGKTAKTYVQSFSRAFPGLINCLDFSYTAIPENIGVYGIPYLRHNKGFDEEIKLLNQKVKEDSYDSNILLIHTNLYGAKDPNGYEIDEVPGIPRNMGKFFRAFDLVLAGHIHKHDVLWKRRVYMVGSPYQQRTSDSGTPMGYLNIYDDMSVEFVRYSAPEFKFYNEGEEKPNDFDFFIEIKKQVSFKQTSEGVTFSNTRDKKALVEQYFKVKGIENARRLNLLIDLLNKAEE